MRLQARATKLDAALQAERASLADGHRDLIASKVHGLTLILTLILTLSTLKP